VGDDRRFEVSWFDGRGELQAGLVEAVGVPFEAVAPVRSFPSYRGQRHFPGWYYVACMDRLVEFESWLERDHALLLDFDPQVVAFAAQPFWLWWTEQGARRRHAPDFFARAADGTGLVVDCRPVERIDERSAQSFAAIQAACEQVGWVYRLVGAIDPVRVGNLRWLSGYRHRRYGQDVVLSAAVEAAFAVPAPLLACASRVADPIKVLPVVFHLLWLGLLTADLSVPLGDGSVVAGRSA
jgi:hypothetical protein